MNSQVEGQTQYSCVSETIKPKLILVHEPGLETRVAIEDPEFWGWDTALLEHSVEFERWLENAQNEHRAFASALRDQGIQVLQLMDLLKEKQDDCRAYLQNEWEKVEPKLKKLDGNSQSAIRDAYEEMLASPVEGIVQGLEFGKKFSSLPYEQRLEVYRKLHSVKLYTLMPQTSLLFVEDPVISVPNGLIKARMAMDIRKQEPDVLEIALGKENYVHRLRNRTEGGDATIAYLHGGDFGYQDGNMVIGISRLSGSGIEKELGELKEKTGIRDIVKLYTPDIFYPELAFITGNVMHQDALQMPLEDRMLLTNRSMLERAAVVEGERRLVNAYEWAKRGYDRIIDVPDNEAEAVHKGLGVNVLPVGNRTIISSTHLPQTNKKLKKTGFDVLELQSENLTYGCGNWHCMTLYLR